MTTNYSCYHVTGLLLNTTIWVMWDARRCLALHRATLYWARLRHVIRTFRNFAKDRWKWFFVWQQGVFATVHKLVRRATVWYSNWQHITFSNSQIVIHFIYPGISHRRSFSIHFYGKSFLWWMKWTPSVEYLIFTDPELFMMNSFIKSQDLPSCEISRQSPFDITHSSAGQALTHSTSPLPVYSMPNRLVSVPKPTRPLSAYNLFFRHERVRILEMLPEREGEKPRNSHGKLGFQEMATIIGKRWKELDDASRAPFVEQARQEKLRHQKALSRYRKYLKTMAQRREEEKSLEPLPFDDSATGGDLAIRHLAGKLDNDMINFIVSKLKWAEIICWRSNAGPSHSIPSALVIFSAAFF